MKIYFEDGQLLPQSMLPFKYHYKVDAYIGYSDCENALRWIKENDNDSVVYTNQITALSSFYAWNAELKTHEIYMRNDSKEFVRIDELADRELRCAQNVMAMYRAGVFGNIHIYDLDKGGV
jgi:hypothetical protein